MLFVLIFIIVNINYSKIKSEPALPSYEMDVGEFKEGEDINNELTRWFINTKTNKCETFQYKGIKGNFNNFRTEIECQRHLENPLSDKIDGCQDTPKQKGSCNSLNIASLNTEKWSWDRSKAACERFDYSGCGGNKNRYDSDEECKIFCYNDDPNYGNPNEGISLNDDEEKAKYAIPSYFDCHLKPDLQTNEAQIKAIALIEEKQCVYVAAGLQKKDKKIRGAFDTINACVQKCFPNEYDESADINERMKQKILACSRVQPDQFEKPSSLTSQVKPTIRYYYDQSNKGCSRFESWPGDFDKSKNNFPSAEICESYCGWDKPEQTEAIERKPACYQPKAGEYSKSDNTNGNLNVKRWYFDSSEDKFKCISFMFGGLNGNNNNFKSKEACKAVCWEHMDPDETNFAAEDLHNGINDDEQSTTS